MPGTAARTLAWAADLFARVRKLRYEGIAIASRIPRMMITTRSSISVKPRSSRARRCRNTLIMWCSLRWLTAVAQTAIGFCSGRSTPERGSKRRGAVSRAPLSSSDRFGCLTAVRDDVAAGAALVVEDAGRLRALDAVPSPVRSLDRDVLDAGVVGLDLPEGRSDVEGLRVVGRVGLHAGDRRADVGLGGRLVRARPEAQVRGNRDREQDSQDDDHDEKLDQREAFVALRRRQPAGKLGEHWLILLGGCVGWLALVIGHPRLVGAPPGRGIAPPAFRWG